jgi:hypothetical protein
MLGQLSQRVLRRQVESVLQRNHAFQKYHKIPDSYVNRQPFLPRLPGYPIIIKAFPDHESPVPGSNDIVMLFTHSLAENRRQTPCRIVKAVDGIVVLSLSTLVRTGSSMLIGFP